MAEQQFPEQYEAAEADAAEQSLPADPEGEENGAQAAEPEELPWEADPADVAEQAVSVPADEDEYR
jgi:hypothetical protein